MNLLRALRLLLLLSVPLATSDADESKNRECSSGWRSLNEQVIRGEGQASIALQCRKNEKPCPPRDELIRRAKIVANAYALANIRAKIKTEVSHEVEVIDGVGSDWLTMKAGGKIYAIVFCNEEINGSMKTLAWGEVK